DAFGVTAPNDAGWGHYAGAIDNLSARASNGYYDWQKVVDGTVTMSTTYATTDTVDDAVEWIAAAAEPWLCQVSFHAAHHPWEAPPPELCTEDLTAAPPASEAPRPYYKAMIEAMDAELGRLLASIPPDVRQRTTVVFLGDNGTPAPVAVPPLGPGNAKGTLFEGGIRVPMIVTGPHVASPGSEAEAFVHAVDLFATVADVAGVPLGTTYPDVLFDGRSILPSLADPTAPSQRTHVFSERFFPNLDGGLPPPSFLCQEDVGLAGPGDSKLSVCGEALFPGNVAALRLIDAPPSSAGFLLATAKLEPVALAGGTILPAPYFAVVPAPTDAKGELSIVVPGGTKTVGGPVMHCQAAVASAGLPLGWDLSNVVRMRFFDVPVTHRTVRNAAGYKLHRHVLQKKTGDVTKQALYALAIDPLEANDILSGGIGLTGVQAAALAELEAALDELLATGPQG
ncbi:MAG: sulfatase-like hydrolase/transferase, partial [Planctomycetota bacterium JB042]